MGIGNTLKKIREKNGLTQEQFADKIGVKRTTYISYEMSKTTPDFELVEKIAEIFGVSLLDFSDEKDENPKSNVWIEFRAPEKKFNSGANDGPQKLTSDENVIINYYRLLQDKDKEEFFEKIKDAYLDIICGVDE